MLQEWTNIFGSSLRSHNAFLDLLDLYSTSRFYHTFSHVEDMLNKNKFKNNTSLILSIIFHDVIYDPFASPGVNEQKSAEYLQKIGKELDLEPMLLDTAEYTITNTKENNYFNALDFSILGSTSEVYNIYSDNIREEYKELDFEAYRLGRIGVLNTLLPRRFSYEVDGCDWTRAKTNMQNEIYTLISLENSV